ncbi:ATP-binding protein [Moorena sp. SIO3I6]|uniref:AAA family ATPase n=1 Tax=Moorena sp. SIO3I6 TaxID=2607831 RepID=UPI0013F7FC2E|nr:ATP-binding protein [Moorena sp. SIO3I6]NEP20864.1 ATP-binding protein [Moorena sp. SIO3I6]
MLVEFSVENYRSFKERQTLSMVASNKKNGRNSNSFPMPNVKSLRLLTSAVVYGPNASGKSNLVRAMQTMRQIVLQSATGMQLGSRWNIEPFRLNADYQNKPSCFEIIFIEDNIRYQYGFSLDQERVYEEWLIAYPKGRAQTWFERNYCSEEQEYDWYFGRGLKGEKERIKGFVRPNSLFLSHAAQNNPPQLGKLFLWFSSKLNLIPSRFQYYYKFTDLKFDISTNYSDNFFKLIKGNDFGLSNGIQQLCEIGGYWINALDNGEILIIDQLDRSLHSEISTYLIKEFNNQAANQNNAQLIVTTHDTTFLDRDIVNQDQIWFTEKGSNNSTKLYSLLDFQVREDESLQKGYLKGRYGAVPFVIGLDS